MGRRYVVDGTVPGAKDEYRFDSFLLHMISFIVEELIKMHITFLNHIIR